MEVVEQMQHLPEFGSGIGFCPTGKRSRDSRPAAAESAAVASSAAALQQRFVEEEEVLQVRAGTVQVLPCSKLCRSSCCMLCGDTVVCIAG